MKEAIGTAVFLVVLALLAWAAVYEVFFSPEDDDRSWHDSAR